MVQTSLEQGTQGLSPARPSGVLACLQDGKGRLCQGLYQEDVNPGSHFLDPLAQKPVVCWGALQTSQRVLCQKHLKA